MTARNQPHKYRCETCDYKDTRCPLVTSSHGVFLSGPETKIIRAHIPLFGCSSHSDATKAEQRIADVIAELERSKESLEVFTVGKEAGVRIGYEEAIALLRGKEE